MKLCLNEDNCEPKASNDFSGLVCTCSNTNIPENSAFMEWKVILQGRTSAVVLSVAYHWFQFWYFSSFVSAYFFRSVELSDHLVNLEKTTVCRLCSLHYMYF